MSASGWPFSSTPTAFSATRQIEALIAIMTEDVDWRDVANAEVLPAGWRCRRYWERQFALVGFSRHADRLHLGLGMISWPLSSNASSISKVSPWQHQTSCFHRYTFASNLVRRMVVYADRGAAVAGTRALCPTYARRPRK